MAKFHDKIRTICSDVEVFLENSVKDAKLSTKAKAEKANILSNIRSLREEWPQLHTKESADKSNLENGSADSGASDSSAPNEVIKNDVTAASVKSGALKSGYLKRKAQGKKGFFGSKDKKYWCVIKDHTFYLFDKDNSKKQSESFSTDGVTCKALGKEKKECPFEVNPTASQTFTFSTTSEDEAKEWIAAISGEEVNEDLYEDADPDKIPGIKSEDVYDEADESLIKTERVEASRSSEIYDDTGTTEDGPIYEEQDGEKEAPPLPPPLKTFNMGPPTTQDSKGQKVTQDDIYDDTIEPDDDIYDEGTSAQQLEDGNPEELYDDLDEVVEEANKKPDIMRQKNESALHRIHSQAGSQPKPPTNPPPKTPQEFDPDADFDNYYYMMWDFKPENDNELQARRGDLLYIRDKSREYKGWWVAQVDGYIGMVPESYLFKAYVGV